MIDPQRSDFGTFRSPLAFMHWSRRDFPGPKELARRMFGGPWARFYTAVGVGLLFALRPTTLPALLGIAVLVAITSFAKLWKTLYAVPVLVVGVAQGGEFAVAATGLLAGGHMWARRSSIPNPVALRLHLAIAELTKSPIKEKYRRLETYHEARNRLLLSRGRGRGGMWRRAVVPDERLLNPVPRFLVLSYAESYRDPAKRWSLANLRRLMSPIPEELVGLTVRYPASFPDSDPGKREKLVKVVSHKLPKLENGQRPGLIPYWHEDEDWVHLRVARPVPDRIHIDDMPFVPHRDVVPLGLTTADSPFALFVEGFAVAVWNLDNESIAVRPNPHMLVAGPTGGGKTVAARTIIHGLREYLKARIWAIDGKKEGAFAYLDNQEGCKETADPAQAKKYILDAYNEMDARYNENDRRRRAGQPLNRYRALVLFIDEYMSLMDQLAKDPQLDDMLWRLVDIARRGRTGRVFLILATQRPDVQNVAGAGTIGQMRSQLGFKLGMGGIDETTARMLYGDRNGHLAHEVPSVPKGRAGVLVDDSLQIIQVAFTPDPLDKVDHDHPAPEIDLATDQLPPPSSGGKGRMRIVTP